MKHKLLYFPLSTNIYNVSCTRINNKQLIRVIYLKVQTIFRDTLDTLDTLSDQTAYQQRKSELFIAATS